MSDKDVKYYYLCPEGLINIADLPNGWGLLWELDNGKLQVQQPSSVFERYARGEQAIMYSILRRVHKYGYLAKPAKKGTE